jgi:hypothetical protein
MTSAQVEKVREAVGIFHSAKDMENAVEELQEKGFFRAEISLLASEAAVREKLGHRFYDAESLEDDPAAPRTAFISTETIGDAEGALIGGLLYVGALAAAGMAVASGGTFGAILIAAAAGAGSGGVLGGILARIVGKHHSEYLQDQLQHGGLLVWVRTRDVDHETRAIEVFRNNNAYDVHLHDIEV